MGIAWVSGGFESHCLNCDSRQYNVLKRLLDIDFRETFAAFWREGVDKHVRVNTVIVELSFITWVSAVVFAAAKALLLWWTQCNCTGTCNARSTMIAKSSVNLLFLLIIVPDVILEAPNVFIWQPPNLWHWTIWSNYTRPHDLITIGPGQTSHT